MDKVITNAKKNNVDLSFNTSPPSFPDGYDAECFSFKALKQLWGFGFRMFLAGLLDAVFSRLDFLIIGKIFSASTLGYFQRAKRHRFLQRVHRPNAVEVNLQFDLRKHGS